MKTILLSRYDALGASSRLRTFQYLPFLNEQGFEVEVAPFFSDEYLKVFYHSGNKSLAEISKAYLTRFQLSFRLKRFDLVWLEKELFPWLPAPFERLLEASGIPYVVDFDDAIHHNYDQHRDWAVRTFLGRKLARVVSHAAAITVGNEYLGEWATCKGGRKVEVIPTVIDLNRYQATTTFHEGGEFRIGWIGSPATTKYLWFVREALQELSSRFPLRLVVIGGGVVDDFGVPLECHPWSEQTEVSLLSTLDAGIMPLPDSPWERGKCGYKLIQYMACALPVIASPVGANCEIVEHGGNGFLADSKEEWMDAIQTLQGEPELRRRFGNQGRDKVVRKYSLQAMAPLIASVLRMAAAR